MKCYADSSFLAQLLVKDFASEASFACYRRLGRPCLPYTPLHDLEVPNGLSARIFSAANAAARSAARRECTEATRRLAHYFTTRCLSRTVFDWESAMSSAKSLSAAHTEKIGVRSLDVLHVSIAGVLNADVFLTCDKRQARLAKQAGFSVELIGSEK